MPYDPNVNRYRDYLAGIEYPDYAAGHTTSTTGAAGNGLDLSLWHGELPPGAEAVVQEMLREAAGTYTWAQGGAVATALAERLGLERSQIFMTAGADDALRIAAQYCLRLGTRTLIPTPCFGRNAYHAMVQQADIVYLAAAGYPYEFDIQKIIDTANGQNIACVFLANPNNPTGHALPREAIETLLSETDCSVILDESMLLDARIESSAALVDAHPNLFVCGSFSKQYGLPGLRIGYLITNQDHAVALRALVSPFGVDGVGLAIARNVLQQDAWLARKTAAVHAGITVLRSLDNASLRISHTSAPVALIEYTGQAGDLYERLREKGVATVQSSDFPGLAGVNAVRVIIRNAEDMVLLNGILAGIS